MNVVGDISDRFPDLPGTVTYGTAPSWFGDGTAVRVEHRCGTYRFGAVWHFTSAFMTYVGDDLDDMIVSLAQRGLMPWLHADRRWAWWRDWSPFPRWDAFVRWCRRALSFWKAGTL